MTITNSQQLFARAQMLIPGGVNSPVRACKSVGAEPLFISSAEGCRIFDADGNGYIDYVGSWGPMLLGHRHPAVIEAVEKVLSRGMSFGAPTELETQMAEIVVRLVPSVEMVRMVNSGTEATMSAVRLARGFTGRDTIVKFDGCYHGHADTLLVDAGSGVATLNIPGSPGIPEAVTHQTLSLPYNDIDTFKQLMDENGPDIAAVIVEPVAGNMGMVAPRENFLDALRENTRKYGALLIFDEVMTGFRVALGGAQERYGIDPDLTCLGKILGGGMPVGAYGGKAEIMAHIAPQGPVYQAGTLSGNPLAMAAGIATLGIIEQDRPHARLDAVAQQLTVGLSEAASSAGIDLQTGFVGGMLGVFFTDQAVTDFSTAKSCNLDRFARFYKGMRDRGVYLAPSQFEALFVSTAHATQDIDTTIQAAGEVFREIAAA